MSKNFVWRTEEVAVQSENIFISRLEDTESSMGGGGAREKLSNSCMKEIT